MDAVSSDLRARSVAAWEKAQEEADNRLRSNVVHAGTVLKAALEAEHIEAMVMYKKDRAAATIDGLRFEWAADVYGVAARPSVVVLCTSCGAEIVWGPEGRDGMRLLEMAGAALQMADLGVRAHTCAKVATRR